MVKHHSMGMIDSANNNTPFRFKCDEHNHNFMTNDPDEFHEHMFNTSLDHPIYFTNGTCFYCGKQLDNPNNEEEIQHRHFHSGKAAHKACRKKLADELNA